VNIVQISTNTADKDVYLENSNKEYALTKKGLMKLMAAANIQIVRSESVAPSSCKRCIEMAKATGKPSQCRDCEHRDDVAWEVTIAVPDISGNVRAFSASREFICADEQAKSKEGQYRQAFAFRAAYAESKALNRAIRGALMIKATYKKDELTKPFAVPVISLNFEDPDMKRAAVARFARGEEMLYGGDPEVKALPEPEEVLLQDEEDEEAPGVFPGKLDFEEEETFVCQECSAVLGPVTDRNGAEWTPARFAEYGKSQFSKVLCKDCFSEYMSKKRNAS
jgi:hypothetical protein